MRDPHALEPALKRKLRVLIVEARFYEQLSDQLARGAIAVLERAGAVWQRLTVPGALEIPSAIALAARTRRFDGFVALGVVIRGETSHYDIVASESARGIMDLSLRGIAIGNGVLTCENEEQANARVDVTGMNKGGAAAEAALRMAAIVAMMSSRRGPR
jgi:6,7-dimethyl-8-ribityllumazine synthase